MGQLRAVLVNLLIFLGLNLVLEEHFAHCISIVRQPQSERFNQSYNHEFDFSETNDIERKKRQNIPFLSGNGGLGNLFGGNAAGNLIGGLLNQPKAQSQSASSGSSTKSGGGSGSRKGGGGFFGNNGGILGLFGLAPRDEDKDIHVSANNDPEAVNNEWFDFKNSFGNLASGRFTDELFRKNMFMENRDKVRQHNDMFGLGFVSFLTRMDDFSDFGLQDFQTLLMGLIVPGNADADRKTPKYDPSKHKFSPRPSGPNVAPTMDYRDYGYVTPIQQQGQCGCCWSFAATGALEGQYYAQTGKLVKLSEQNLIDCAKDSYNNHGCNGGWPMNAYKYVKQNGIMTDGQYRFIGKDTQACKYNNGARVGDLQVTGMAYLPEGDEEALKEAIYNIGPIAIAINGDAWGFQHYAKGVYKDDTCSKQVNHAMLAVGYGEENGLPYWLIKNSWGTNWGDGGYIKWARNNNNQCGIASWAQYPILGGDSGGSDYDLSSSNLRSSGDNSEAVAPPDASAESETSHAAEDNGEEPAPEEPSAEESQPEGESR